MTLASAILLSSKERRKVCLQHQRKNSMSFLRSGHIYTVSCVFVIHYSLYEVVNGKYITTCLHFVTYIMLDIPKQLNSGYGSNYCPRLGVRGQRL